MVIKHPSNQEGAGLFGPRRFILPSPHQRPPSPRVRLREFSFRLVSPGQTHSLLASLKDHLQWMARQLSERPQPGPPSFQPPTYHL